MNSRIEKLTESFIPKSDNSNITTIQNYDQVTSVPNLTISEAREQKRLKKLTLSEQGFKKFLTLVEHFSVTDLEYVAAYRFFLAKTLDRICANQLGTTLHSILQDRQAGAMIVEVENFQPDASRDFDKMLKFSTAVSYLFGKANLDSMSGLYYARFSVENKDSSDSFLRKFSERMTLHNDGTFVNELTDYVLMMKVAEKEVTGGHSLLLHLDDWEDLETFYHHPLSSKSFKFSSPPSKRVDYSVHHPIFHQDKEGLPCMSYIDQFIKPATPDEGLYAYALNQSLETSRAVIGFELPVGSLVICNNHFWLHGRDKFANNTHLYRELMRQRGVFFNNLFQQPYPDEVKHF